jgi:hypothetical protein
MKITQILSESTILDTQDVTKGKITLITDPNWYGAEVGDYKATGSVVNISANKLVGFEPDDKMTQPKSKANVEKIVAGLKQGDKLPPLLVRKYKNGYQVLDGHHRFWAYKLLGTKSIPVQIVPDSDIEEKGQQDVTEDSYKDTSGTFMDRLVGEIMNYQSLNNVNPKLNDFSSAVKSKLKSLGEIKAKLIYQQALKQSDELSGQQDVAESIGEMAEFSLNHNMYDSLSPQQIKMLKSSLQKYGAEDVAVTDKSTVFQVNSKSLDSLRRDLRQNKIQIDTQFSEAVNPAQQAAIAVNMKKDHNKPKSVAEDSSESKSNVTSAITDFYKTQLSQSKPGKVENYNSKAKELLSQATGKQRTKVLTMLKAGSKNPYLQGVIITIVGSIVSGAVIKHFGSMGLSPQQFNMILQGSMNSIIPTLAAKLHGMSWSDAIKTGLASVAVGVSSAGIMEDNAEYDDESGMAHTNLHTIIRAAEGLLDTIDDNENLPEWVQEKIANVEGMIVSSWDYLKSQEEQGIDPQVNESNWLQEELNKLDEVAAWQKKSGKNKTGGLNQKGVNSYRREHPGSKLQTAVTTKPSKLKPGSKAAKRRKSFCARMSGVKGPMKKDGKPTRKALALRKWNC